MSEQEREEATSGTTPGATRSQHVVLQGPADARMMTAAMRPGLERSREGGAPAAPVCLVLTPTIEQALTAGEEARRLLGAEGPRVVPVSGTTRARRVLATAPVAVVTGTPADLLQLRRDAALDLQGLQSVVVIGLDDILAADGRDTLQALLGDAPGDVSRVATVDSDSEDDGSAVTEFLEAQFRRARRMTPLTLGDAPLATAPRFLITSLAGRADALRLLLDEIDPPSVALIVSSDAGADDATTALQRLGVAIDGTLVQVTRQPTAEHVALSVLWEAPASYDALVQAVAMRPVHAVALLMADELPTFRRMTGGAAEAWTPAVKKASAEGRIQGVRAALRATLADHGVQASELALLAPLLESHDAIEIACAALRMYEGAQREVQAITAKAAAAAAAKGSAREGRGDGAGAGAITGKARVFLAVGSRDGARVGDIVGAIANETGIPGERIGQIELFESHAIVELDGADATKAIAVLGDVSLRGRRLNARLDDRGGSRGGPRDGERGGGRDRGERSDRGPRGPRSGAGGPRKSFGGGADRGPRGERSERGPRAGGAPRGNFGGPRGEGRGGAGRPPRAADERRAFGDRPVRERAEGRAEWAERGDRMKHAKRAPRAPFTRDAEG